MLTSRTHFNSGPGQYFDLGCLQVGKIYEVKAKIKLYDQNGFPFQCSGNVWNDPLSCPLFTIVLTLPTGEIRIINEWNDIHEVPWYADHFNEFHALFQADLELVGAVSAHWYFRGVQAGINVAFDDVSIMLYEHQINSGGTVAPNVGCQGKFSSDFLAYFFSQRKSNHPNDVTSDQRIDVQWLCFGESAQCFPASS